MLQHLSFDLLCLLSSFCRTVRGSASKHAANTSSVHTLSHVTCRTTLQTDRSPIILLPRSGVPPARSDSNVETCSEGSLDRREQYHSHKAVKQYRMARMDELSAVEEEQGGRSRPQESPFSPSLALPAPWKNLFSKVTFHLPVWPNFQGETQRWNDWQQVSNRFLTYSHTDI